MKKLSISFGAFADQIIKQLTVQSYDAPASKIAHFQQDADAICRLRIRGVLTDGEAHKANGRLFKMICKVAKNQQPTPGKEEA